ncbi:hypothetical protein EVAR_88952_1 [Eumeta japonica]|uniref:Uncharacterized protein n=1 Tax=Eumeta variegata TaxID=151549 RepID=A0A4C1VQG8_EUMVA|nr:hypothetical protein EVAR_88952_1 [Eumeta japonica]
MTLSILDLTYNDHLCELQQQYQVVPHVDLGLVLHIMDILVLLPTTSGQWSRRASGRFLLGSPEVSARYSRIDKSKNAALRRASAYPTPSTDPEREHSNAK